MEQVTGGQLVAEALIQRSVPYVFTLSGGHITPIYQHLDGTDVKLFDTRHEQSAVFMAEAWGKLTRTPGVAMVTAGPGFTNALTGVASASFSNTPLVLIAGSVGIENKERLDLQDMPQAAVVAPMVKQALVCQKTERVAEYVDLAFRSAASGRPGPVYLELPVDVLNMPVQRGDVRAPLTMIRSQPADATLATQALEMIQKAQKPVVIAGTGAWQAGAEAELRAFAEHTHVPVFTSLGGRGVIADSHPLCFESALAIRPGCALHAYLSTDLIIVLGTRISLFYLFGELFNPSAKMIQVDIKAEELGRNRAVTLPIVSDVKAFLAVCNQKIERHNLAGSFKKRFEPWIAELNQAHDEGRKTAGADWVNDNTPIHPMRLAAEIDRFMERPDDIVVADGGDTTTWMGMTRTIDRPGHYLDYGLFGSLAVGLPYANAAKLRYPDKRVLLVTGDGSVGFNFMEFETALRKQLPIVVVISNDLGWGMIRHSQEIRLGKAIETGTYIGRVDYHQMVAALGGAGYFVERADQIRPALEAAFAAGRAACINVMTDPTTVSPGSMALANVGAYKAS